MKVCVLFSSSSGGYLYTGNGLNNDFYPCTRQNVSALLIERYETKIF